MIITHSSDRMTIRSLQQIKTFMALLLFSLGPFLVLLAYSNDQLDWVAVATGLACSAGGLLLAWDVKYIVVRLEKSGPSSIAWRRLLKLDTITFDLADVQAVEKEEYTGILGNGSVGPNDILQLKIKGVGLVRIAATRNDSLYARLMRPFRRQGKKIAEFIGVDYVVKEVDLLKESFTATEEPKL